MHTPSGPRKTAKLSESVQHQLNMYALAASAAGIGIVTLAPSAEGRIVYTPANVSITQGAGAIQMDVNNDGNPDFAFSNYYISGSCCTLHDLTITGDKKADAVVAIHSQRNGHKRVVAGDLGAGFQIGTNLRHGFFQRGPVGMAEKRFVFNSTNSTTYRTSFGPWRNVTNKYVGLKFLVAGKIHYGWARLTVMGFENVTLTGYAYETVAGKAIPAGKKSGPEKSATGQIGPATITAPVARRATLALLALGSPALPIWRREESESNAMNGSLPGEAR
jgi:hypothetical protein